jgi:hypothetical protein
MHTSALTIRRCMPTACAPEKPADGTFTAQLEKEEKEKGCEPATL